MLEPVIFQYRNHKGRFDTRRVSPRAIEFIAKPDWGYQPGWFLTGWDLDKNAKRSFALTHIVLSEWDNFRLALVFHPAHEAAIVPVSEQRSQGLLQTALGLPTPPSTDPTP